MMHSHQRTILALGLAPGLVGLACAGAGGDFEEVEKAVVVDTCGNCHDPGGLDGLADRVARAAPALFDEARFPAEMFPFDVRGKTTAQIIASANPPRDATIDPAVPAPAARILHELHKLDQQFQEAMASDFTSQAGFDRYNTFGEDMPLGCETIDRLKQAARGTSTQMPPRWTQPLFEALSLPAVTLSDADRETLEAYVISSLPDGLASCL